MQIDLFTLTCLFSYHLPVYFSLTQDLVAWVIDNFSISEKAIIRYAFPPFRLII